MKTKQKYQELLNEEVKSSRQPFRGGLSNRGRGFGGRGFLVRRDYAASNTTTATSTQGKKTTFRLNCTRNNASESKYCTSFDKGPFCEQDSQGSISRKNPTLPIKLAKINPGSKYSFCCPGLRDSISFGTPTKPSSLGSSNEPGGKDTVEQRGSEYATEGCYLQGISCKRTISEQPVCNQEKRWVKQTNYKFEKFKQFHTLSPFQKGKFAFTKRSTATKRFYVQNRPKRRLFLRTNKQKLKKISEISMGRKPIRVPLPLFWSWSSPTNIYKAPKNTNSYPQENNGEDHSVSRRHVIDVKDHKGVVSGKRDVDFSVTKLGLCNKSEKISAITSPKIEFLGLLIDSRAMTLSLPEEKVLEIQNRCTQLILNPQTLVIELTRLIGKLSFTAQAVLPGRLQHRSLQLQQIEALRLTQSYQSKVVLNLQSLEELQWWKENLSLQNGRPLKIGQADLVIQTDASMTGWGASCQGVSTGGK